MATFLIKREIPITRQQGDKADIVINVPVLLPLAGKTVKFQVRDSSNRVLINKSSENITIEEQKISILLLPIDTARRAGKHRWELEISDEDGPVTIGKGPFTIISTDIP